MIRLVRMHSAVAPPLISLLLLSGPLWARSAADVLAEDQPLSGGVVDILDKGGPIMILILVGSVVAIAFAIERAVSLRKSTLFPAELVNGVRDAGNDTKRIGKLVSSHEPSPLARILAAGIKREKRGPEAVESAMISQGAHEVARLKRPVKPIAILATVQPLLGLLGTIIGMIGTFNALAQTATAERVETLAPGIGTALYTTAAGLCAAIPCVLLYHWLMGRVNRAAMEWSSVGTDLVTAIEDGGKRR